MTNRLPRKSKTGITVIPIGIYCYFVLSYKSESCEVSDCQQQSVNKRYLNMSNPPICEETLPSSADFSTTKVLLFSEMCKYFCLFFAYLHIFLYFCIQFEQLWMISFPEAKRY